MVRGLHNPSNLPAIYWVDALGCINSGVHSAISGYGSNITGDCSCIDGNVSDLSGDVSGLIGDCTGIEGTATNIIGDLGHCELTPSDRASGVDIRSITFRT